MSTNANNSIIKGSSNMVLAVFMAEQLKAYLNPASRRGSEFSRASLDSIIDEARKFANEIGLKDEPMGGSVDGELKKALPIAISMVAASESDLAQKLKPILASAKSSILQD